MAADEITHYCAWYTWYSVVLLHRLLYGYATPPPRLAYCVSAYCVHWPLQCARVRAVPKARDPAANLLFTIYQVIGGCLNSQRPPKSAAMTRVTYYWPPTPLSSSVRFAVPRRHWQFFLLCLCCPTYFVYYARRSRRFAIARRVQQQLCRTCRTWLRVVRVRVH